MRSAAVDQLAAEVRAAKLDRPQFESLIYRLGPQQRRLFLRLARGPATTVDLRRECSIGNVSQIVIELNGKLAAVDDPRRVSCELVSHKNQFGESGRQGLWRLESNGGRHARPRTS